MPCVRRPRADRGASIVEFALIAPVMALIVMGVVDLARAYELQVRLENAAREGAAYAQLYPNDVSCGSGRDIGDRVAGEDADLPAHDGYGYVVYGEDGAGDTTVPVTGCGGTTIVPGERVRVEVGATFTVVTPIVANVVGGSIDMTGSAEVEVQG